MGEKEAQLKLRKRTIGWKMAKGSKRKGQQKVVNIETRSKQIHDMRGKADIKRK